MKISKDLKKLTTTQGEMAKILGITQPRVHQLIEEGVVVRDDNSGVLVVESMQNFYKLKSKITDEPADFEKEKALHEKAKRELAEIELAEKRGDMHNTQDIEIMVGGLITVFKKNILAIPSKMALVLSGKQPEEVNEILTQEMSQCLTELSQFDVTKLGDMNGDEEEN